MSTDNEKEQKAPAEKKITMRNHWFDHVAKTRKKLTRARKQPITHREAMREASVTWTAIKDRVRKRMVRNRGDNPRPVKKVKKKA